MFSNDKGVFAAEILKLDPFKQQTILDFLANLEDWQQIQFISFVASMAGQEDKKLFLENLAGMASDNKRLEYVNLLHIFSPTSISHLMGKIKQVDFQTAAKKVAAWHKKLADAIEKSANKGRR